MSPYENLLAKYENLKSCRNELLEIVKGVQPNGFLQKAIRRAKALQEAEKSERVLLQYQKHMARLNSISDKLQWDLNDD